MSYGIPTEASDIPRGFAPSGRQRLYVVMGPTTTQERREVTHHDKRRRGQIAMITMAVLAAGRC
jgi:hypothetical protein